MKAPRASHPWAIVEGGRVRWHVPGSWPPEYAVDDALEALWREGQKRRTTMQPFYQSDTITLYHGDCLDVMPKLAAQSFDAIITDVPYGTTACAWDSPIPFEPMWECLKRLARPRAAVVLFGSEPFSSALRASNFGWFKYDWVWEKSEGTGHLDAAARPLKYHEIVSVFCDGEPDYYPQKWQGEPNHSRTNSVGKQSASNIHNRSYVTPVQDASGMKYPRSVIHFNIIKPTIKRHVSEKPLALMEYLIRTYTNEGDTILDFTSGSGTTLRAAKNLKRRCVGIEQDLHYCEVTVKRLEPAFEEALVDDGASLEDLPMFAVESEAA